MTDWSEYEQPDWEALEAEALEASEPVLIDPAWRPYSTEEIFMSELPATPMLVPGLDIGPGRPNGLVGGPGAGKTLVAIAIGLGVLSGKAVFGELAVGERGRVCHVTYDMGAKAVSLRYRQLANGMGIRPEEVSGRLVLCAHPKINLATVGAGHMFSKLLKGFSLCILDNVRDAAPGADENESTFGAFLTEFGTACEQAGCVGLYLHHTKKNLEGLSGASLRGSSAILAASGSIWGLEGEGDEPRTMVHLRAHDMSDGPLEPLTLNLEKGHRGAFDTGKHTRAFEFRIGGYSPQQKPKEKVSDEILKLEVQAALSAEPGITYRALAARLRAMGLSFRDQILNEILTEAKEEKGLV